jgi:hypothetical protein
LVQRDVTQDLALLKFENPIAYTPVHAVTRRVNYGDDILAFGFPLSYSLTLARGSITNTSVEGGLWLTDAAVNRGHSGGPAVSVEGDVIGVIKAGIEPAQGMRLVIPIVRASPLFGIAGVPISSDAARPAAVPFAPVTVTGTYVAPNPGWDRGMPSTKYCGNNPESWVRGSASFDPTSGTLTVTIQLETDSIAAGPQGRVVIIARDGAGSTVVTVTSAEIGTGGKPPGSAAIRNFTSQINIPQQQGSRMRMLHVEVECRGAVRSLFGGGNASNQFGLSIR